MAHQPTVFVVDDDSGVRRSLRALGRSHGLTVETYASAQAFLAAFDPDRPGCLLLDVRLAGRNGLDIQDELRQRGHSLPIIVLTGHGDVPTSVRAFRGGALDFLEKPVPPRALCTRRTRPQSRSSSACLRSRREPSADRPALPAASNLR